MAVPGSSMAAEGRIRGGEGGMKGGGDLQVGKLGLPEFFISRERRLKRGKRGRGEVKQRPSRPDKENGPPSRVLNRGSLTRSRTHAACDVDRRWNAEIPPLNDDKESTSNPNTLSLECILQITLANCAKAEKPAAA